MTALNFCVGINQIGQTLHLRQIHPIVQQCPPGKFAGLRQPSQPRFLDCTEDCLHDGHTAVALKFHDFFARKTRFLSETQDNGLIEDFTGLIAQEIELRLARLGYRPTQSGEDSYTCWTR